jgi:replicative DNA helicase
MEQQILSALLMRNEIIDDLRVTFDVSHFKEMLHRQILRGYAGPPQDGRSFNPITLRADLRRARSAG